MNATEEPTAPAPPRRGRRLPWYVRLAVLAGCAWLLVSVIDLGAAFERLRSIERGGLVLLFVLNTATYVLFAVRWSLFCGALGLPSRLGGRLRGVYLLQVASQVVPPVLGEGARFLSFPSGTSKVAILKSIALDRLSNQVALSTLVLALVPFYARSGYPSWFLGVLALPALGLGAVALLGRRVLPASWRERFDFLTLLTRPGLALRSLGLGWVLCTLTALEFWVAARALGVDVDGTIALFAPAQCLAVALAPFSFGEWGVREVVALVALEPTGIAAEEAVAISMTLGLVNVVASLPGLALFFVGGSVREDAGSEPHG